MYLKGFGRIYDHQEMLNSLPAHGVVAPMDSQTQIRWTPPPRTWIR